MITTKPVYGEASHLGCSRVHVKFKEARCQGVTHHLGDVIGSQLILVNYNQPDSTYQITYINSVGLVLKRVAYTRETVQEVDMQESVCRIVFQSPLKVL